MNREYGIRYDREYGKFIRTPVYGEGVFSDMMKNIGSKLFGETMKKTVKTGLQKGAEKAFENAAAKTGDYAAKKAGNKIIEMLSKKQPAVRMEPPKKAGHNIIEILSKMQPAVRMEPPPTIKQRQSTKTKLSQREINERVNRILSGGK